MVRFSAICLTVACLLCAASNRPTRAQEVTPKTRLVYQIETEDETSPIPKEKMDQLLKAVRARLRASNSKGTVQALGNNRLEVVVSTTDEDDLNQVKSLLSKPGTLEFAVLANRVDHTEIISKAKNLEGDLKKEGQLVAGWRELGVDSTGQPKAIGDQGKVVTRQNKQSRRTEYLVVFEPERMTGDYLSRAYKTTDGNGQLALGLQFNKKGGQIFKKLTSNNRPDRDGFGRRLAILLDDQIHSAPTILAVISDRAQITGRFTHQEIDALVTILKAGALPLKLKAQPITVETIESGKAR